MPFPPARASKPPVPAPLPTPSEASSFGPDVDVIVVTYNSREHFARLRAALENQTTPFRLFVVDNASRPEQQPTARDMPAGAVIIQMDENVGFAKANNHAARLGEAKYIALLNPDAFPNPDWLARLTEAAERWPEAAAFGSTQISDENQSRLDGLGDCYSFSGVPWRGGYGWPRDTPIVVDGEVFSPCAAAALYRADAWRAVGGFDESFFCYCEDVDLGFRLRLTGASCVQVKHAVVRHIGGASSGPRSAFAVFHGTRNRLWTFAKNMPAPMLWLSAPAHIAMTLAFLLYSIFRGTAAPTWSGVIAGLMGLPRILRQRRRVQATRVARAVDLARILVWSPYAMLTRAPVVRPHARRETLQLKPAARGLQPN